jgi:leucyl/phenylalanyl-tRNA--protein transferase
MIPLLAPGAPFPAVTEALGQPYNGLLAATENIEVERLLAAYRSGVFPWYGEGEPVLWWSPDPRMVLHTAELKVSRSLRRRLRNALQDSSLSIRVDSAFMDVMHACAQPRRGQQGTWITDDILAAYGGLHQRGLAHSVEIWHDSSMIGGLYGVGLGRMFYGESMFARATDASKIALATLVQIVLEARVAVIDCQQNTEHLASLGAREIPRRVFCAHVAQVVEQPGPDWRIWQQGEPKDAVARLLDRV